ncbi:MAG: hypothetical protein DHS20C18_24030 [Saprospiraceae bacterium]|nr:MAG: hypothetical protein DHS20C18_24030 [Saprospiraceae bacterium]
MATAQVELKINPLGLLFSRVSVAAEFVISDDFGVEGSPFIDFLSVNLGDDTKYKTLSAGMMGAGKYYFGPSDGADRFYAGVYLRFKSGKYTVENGDESDGFKRSRVALGILTGYKWVSEKNVVFEIGMGLGRAVSNVITTNDGFSEDFSEIPVLNFDFVGRLAVGYRFGVR